MEYGKKGVQGVRQFIWDTLYMGLFLEKISRPKMYAKITKITLFMEHPVKIRVIAYDVATPLL
jgi:hypothetical protein